jgi:branched-chain amino acid transport system permease protein
MYAELMLTLIYTFLFGSLYLGIALGFSIIVGVMRVFYVAYPALFLIAAYGTWMFWRDFRLPFELSMVLSFALMFAISIVIYKFLVNKFLEVEDYMLVALVLVFLAIEQVVSLVYPEMAGVYLPTLVIPGTIDIGPLKVPGQFLLASIISIAMTIIYIVLFVKTKTGLLMRAISQSYLVSKIMGINFDLTFMIAMIIASIPPGVIMLLISPTWALNPYVGWTLFTYGIMVAVLGGLGNLKGTIMAAYLVGFIHSVVAFAFYQPRLSGLMCLIIVVIILALRPRGLARAETIW